MTDGTDVTDLLALDVWAVVGLSNDRSRAAYGVAQFLQARGKRIVPVHPSAPEVHGEQGFATLAEVPFPVDVVDCFVNSRLVGPVVDQAVTIGARGVWMQLGVVDDDAAARARQAGLTVVMDRCRRSSGADARRPGPAPEGAGQAGGVVRRDCRAASLERAACASAS